MKSISTPSVAYMQKRRIAGVLVRIPIPKLSAFVTEVTVIDGPASLIVVT